MPRLGRLAMGTLAVCALAGCSAKAPGVESADTIRLVGRFAPESVVNRSTATAEQPRAEWRFVAASGAAPAWAASEDVTHLEVREGRLAGRSSGDWPMLSFPRLAAMESADQIEALEVRMRVGAGKNFSAQFALAPKVDFASLERLAERNPFLASSPITAGPDFQTYLLAPLQPLQGVDFQTLVFRPTDVAGAEFEIESLRVLFRREKLAALPTGVSWQGLGDIFRESLVARSPEILRFPVDLPRRAWLDLAVGSADESPLTFVVRARAASTSGPAPVEVRRTVTTAFRWEALAVDLTELSGQPAVLELEIEAASPAGIGFWGAPAVRSDGRREARRPRGVILIQADTLRRDHLDLYGHARATAPNLARWAGSGVVFRHAVSQAPWTKASTPSILASLYPTSHGVREFADRLPASATTVAEAFRDAGYATMAVASVPFVGQMTNLHQGFEEFHESTSHPWRGGPLSAKTSREYVDRLLGWIERRRDAPWFAFLHVFDPHSPYEPYAPYNRLWVPAELEAEHEKRRDALAPTIADEFMRVRKLPSRAETVAAGIDPDAYVAVESAWYDASIRAMDAELARLFERLREAGRDDDTLVVLLSDHGTEFYEHGTFFHGHSVHGELTQVPLIARWPGGIAAGRSIEPLVQTIDVMPTLLELAGVAIPSAAQGQSLAPFLSPAARQEADGSWPSWRARPAISERYPSAPNSPAPRDRVTLSIMDERWRLLRNLSPGLPPHELYDWRADPLDQHDLAATEPETVNRLAADLDAWRKHAEAGKLPSDATAAESMSAEQLQHLRSLGYLR